MGESFQMQMTFISFMIFSRMSLHCKLVPVQYREYEIGLLGATFDSSGKVSHASPLFDDYVRV